MFQLILAASDIICSQDTQGYYCDILVLLTASILLSFHLGVIKAYFIENRAMVGEVRYVALTS